MRVFVVWHVVSVRVAGVNIKAGYLFVAVVDWAGDGSAQTPVVSSSNRFEPNTNLAEVEKFADLRDRVRQFLAPVGVDRAALMETRQFAQLRYVDAYARVTKICAVMDATHVLGVPFSTEKTGDVARTLNLQASTLQLFENTRVGMTANPMYWTTGLSEAAAVAMHVLGDPAAVAGGGEESSA